MEASILELADVLNALRAFLDNLDLLNPAITGQ